MIPKDIEKWDNIRWEREVVYCRPSSGGAVGVAFVWMGTAWKGTGSNSDTYKNKEAAFVIKPIQGSAAPTKFAEHILGKIGGAVSPNSKPIPRRSYGGSGIAAMFKKFRSAETDQAVKARWNQIFGDYDRCDAFLIQETQVGIKEFGDEYRKTGGLDSLLKDKNLMTNLGRLFVADALIGNGDRLSNLNTGNIIFKSDGTLCSIDSTTILTSFDGILKDTSNFSNMHDDELSANAWASQDIIKKGGYQVPSAKQQSRLNQNEQVAIPSTFAVNDVFDLDKWWGTFKFRTDPKGTEVAAPVWDQAKKWFTEGVNQGLKQIDSKLSGLNWLMVKNKYKNFVNRYGGDPNVDWTNFKIRRKYFKLRKKGLTEAQALKIIQDYVAKKMPGL